MKNDFNINITEINQGEMSLSSIFDTLVENIEKQFIEEINPMFVYLVQELSKKKLHKNDEFKLKKKIDKYDHLQYKIVYRDLHIKFTILTNQADSGHIIKYCVKDEEGDIFDARYQYQIFEKFNSPNSEEIIPPNVYKENSAGILYPKRAHRIDRFIRMIDNLDTFLSRDKNNEPIEGYTRIDTINKRKLSKLIFDNNFSVI